MSTNAFPAESVEFLATHAHDPAFFEKLACDWNITPRSEKEGAQLLELATLLREAKDRETVKEASDGNQFLGGAIDSLKVAMHSRGYDTPPPSEVIGIKNLAAQLCQNPAFQKAALDYGTFLANAAQGK